MVLAFSLAALLPWCVLAEFQLPALPYDYDALEPHIDAETMRVHHGKHHAAYVTNLNAAAKSLPEFAKGDAVALASLQAKANSEALRNHGGGHYNHALFWVNLQPASAPLSEPSADLIVAIEDRFTSLDGLKEAFSKAAMSRFGSGWAWLGVKADGRLAITTTANQDNPLMEGLPYEYEKMVPILGLDVWEHAYYLKYQNRRAEYVAAFWNLVNWHKVSRNFEKYARNGKPVPPTTTGGKHETEL